MPCLQFREGGNGTRIEVGGKFGWNRLNVSLASQEMEFGFCLECRSSYLMWFTFFKKNNSGCCVNNAYRKVRREQEGHLGML